MRVAPYSPAWSTRIIDAAVGRGGRRGASRVMRAAPCAVSHRITAAPPSDRIAFHPAIEMPRKRELHLVAADQRRLRDLARANPRSLPPPASAVQVVMPSKMPSFDPGMIDADRCPKSAIASAASRVRIARPAATPRAR